MVTKTQVYFKSSLIVKNITEPLNHTNHSKCEGQRLRRHGHMTTQHNRQY